jgi:hypothetical protein
MGIITSSSFAKALWPGVNSWYGEMYGELPVKYTEMFDTFKSTRAYEEDVGITSFGLARIKPEGQAIDYDTESQAYITRYTHVVYALGFVMTREIVEDDQYDVVGKRRARGLAFSMRQTKEIVAANVYNRAFNSAYSGGDGAAMCAAHTNYAGGTQSNQPTNTTAALSEAAIEQAIIDMGKWTNDRGLRIAVRPTKLIVPVDLEFEAGRILGSPYRPSMSTNKNTGAAFTFAPNDVNQIYANSRIPDGYFVNNYLSSSTAWFLRTDVQDGLKHFERRDMEFAIDNDFETENAKFKASERYSFGWTDYRAIYGCQGS